jgi:hypothetical protein
MDAGFSAGLGLSLEIVKACVHAEAWKEGGTGERDWREGGGGRKGGRVPDTSFGRRRLLERFLDGCHSQDARQPHAGS